MKPRQSGSPDCELCGDEAALHCAADGADLCWRCDRRVHSANFLVARHRRRVRCSACCCPNLALSGPGSDCPIRSVCRACGGAESESESSCVSSAGDRPPAKRRRTMEEWGKGMGLRPGVAGAAAKAAECCGREEMAAVPERAASRIRGGARGLGRVLRRLERCSGVPADVIVSCEARLARAMQRRRRRRRTGTEAAAEAEEGWGECK